MIWQFKWPKRLPVNYTLNDLVKRQKGTVSYKNIKSDVLPKNIMSIMTTHPSWWSKQTDVGVGAAAEPNFEHSAVDYVQYITASRATLGGSLLLKQI